MHSDMLVKANNLSRLYSNHCAVADLNLTLSKGEVLGLLGPNGAGKSTTMQMLTGNLAPSTGEILINNTDPLLEAFGEVSDQAVLHFIETATLACFGDSVLCICLHETV